MTAARTGRKQPSIRTLWAIAKSPELHLTDEDLHAVVYRETGKESMKMLTQGEVNTVARVLQNMKDSVSRSVRDKRTDTGGDIRTTAQRRKIYALCEALGWNDDPRRIQGFVKRVAHVDRIEWLNMAQCEKVIEGLKAISHGSAGRRRSCDRGTSDPRGAGTHSADAGQHPQRHGHLQGHGACVPADLL